MNESISVQEPDKKDQEKQEKKEKQEKQKKQENNEKKEKTRIKFPIEESLTDDIGIYDGRRENDA